MKDLRSALLAGRPLIGGYVQTASPEILEITGQIGFDYVILSSEDTAYDPVDRASQVYLAEGLGLATLFRPPSNDAVQIRRALDLGMDGVNVPMVETAEDARAAVDAVKFPPLGRRGLNSMSRPVRYGADFNPAFFERANEHTVVTVLIESRRAVDNIDEILEVEGIDIAYLGPTDLSISLGVPGQPNHPLVRECVGRVRESARRHGVGVAHVVYDPFDRSELEEKLAAGYAMLSVFLDLSLFRQSAQRLHREVRGAFDAVGGGVGS